jgi:glyoxylase-like metal-dependent hydrolase (beta-lactamase superfamily II)
VYVHADELSIAAPADLATIERYANLLDRWLILPMLRAMPRRWAASSLAGATLRDSLRAFGPGPGVPGLPEWLWIATPGHSPGHVAYFRPRDRVLLTGDAVLTVDINSVWGWAAWGLGINRPDLFLPPWYTNSDQRRARLSIAVLAGLQPRVLATGHGPPLLGQNLAGELRAVARRVTRAP